MPIVDPKGAQKYWYDGLPFEGVLLRTNDTGTQKYWYDGLPAAWWIFPPILDWFLKALPTRQKDEVVPYE